MYANNICNVSKCFRIYINVHVLFMETFLFNLMLLCLLQANIFLKMFVPVLFLSLPFIHFFYLSVLSILFVC